MEKELSARYRRNVKIHQGKKRGRIELEYYDQGDLELLLGILDAVQSGNGRSL
jgi:ParB family chromosome partitioning protein